MFNSRVKVFAAMIPTAQYDELYDTCCLDVHHGDAARLGHSVALSVNDRPVIRQCWKLGAGTNEKASGVGKRPSPSFPMELEGEAVPGCRV